MPMTAFASLLREWFDNRGEKNSYRIGYQLFHAFDCTRVGWLPLSCVQLTEIIFSVQILKLKVYLQFVYV